MTFDRQTTFVRGIKRLPAMAVRVGKREAHLDS